MIFEFSSGAVIFRKDQDGKILFLLLEKANGEYDLPKGHIEKGESAVEAAKREITEETGLSVEFIPGFSIMTKYFFYKNKSKVLKKNKLFLAEVRSSKVTISPEHKGYSWLTFEEITEKIKYKNTKTLFKEASSYIRKKELMDKLNSEYAKLPSSEKIWNLSKRLVPGEGPLNASVMLVGQAPGKNEDESLRPFIGRSGKLLSSMMYKAGINRSDTYITSTVQFFPPANRLPTENEVALCMPFLMRQIEIIKPSFIITLGSLSGKVLAGVESIEKEHGRIIKRNPITYMVTYHPAAALRFKRVLELMSEDFKKFGREINAGTIEINKE